MRYDKISSLVWLVSSILIILGSLAYPFGNWDRPGPGFLPLLCGSIIGVLSLVIFIQASLRDKGKTKREEDGSFFTARWTKLVTALILLLAYAFFFETFGFLTMTFVFMILVLKLVEPTKWWVALIVSILTTTICYFLFEKWLNIPMPTGFWPDLFSRMAK